MSKLKLSAEERAMLKDFEAGGMKSRLSPKRIIELRSAAEETFKKDGRINIRLSSRDLEGL
jgi:predicted DNA binding CopG/RHH family protein